MNKKSLFLHHPDHYISLQDGPHAITLALDEWDQQVQGYSLPKDAVAQIYYCQGDQAQRKIFYLDREYEVHPGKWVQGDEYIALCKDILQAPILEQAKREQRNLEIKRLAFDQLVSDQTNFLYFDNGWEARDYFRGKLENELADHPETLEVIVDMAALLVQIRDAIWPQAREFKGE